MDLEIQVATDELHLIFCNGIAALGIAVSLHIFGNTDPDKPRNLIVSTVEDNLGLLKHSGFFNLHSEQTDLQIFFGLLKAATNDANEEYIAGSLSQASKDAVVSAAPDYLQVIDAIFVRSWDTYLTRKAALARQLEVKTFVEEELRENVTSDVAEELTICLLYTSPSPRD